jgi:N6-L-threonylcarbamoyladenine synthase
VPLCKIRGFILAIESSCDDTAAAVLHNDKVLSNVVANQLIHAQYGGVAGISRAHQQNIKTRIDAAIEMPTLRRNSCQR